MKNMRMTSEAQVIETPEIQATYRMQDQADCAAKELSIKWLRLAQLTIGEVI